MTPSSTPLATVMPLPMIRVGKKTKMASAAAMVPQIAPHSR